MQRHSLPRSSQGNTLENVWLSFVIFLKVTRMVLVILSLLKISRKQPIILYTEADAVSSVIDSLERSGLQF